MNKKSYICKIIDFGMAKIGEPCVGIKGTDGFIPYEVYELENMISQHGDDLSEKYKELKELIESKNIRIENMNNKIDELDKKNDLKIDAVLIDYLDLMMPAQSKVSPSDLFIKDKFVSEEIIGTTHYSVVANAIPSALYFMFDGYAPISMVEFQTKIVKLDKGYTQYLIDKYTNLQEKLGIDIKPRLTDFKAIEAAILKNKAYPELQELSKYAEKNYPKTTLSVYHQALYYEKMGEFKKATKEYKKAFTKEEIRELTKDFMISRSEDLKNKQDESKVEEYAEPLPVEEGEKKEGEE